MTITFRSAGGVGTGVLEPPPVLLLGLPGATVVAAAAAVVAVAPSATTWLPARSATETDADDPPSSPQAVSISPDTAAMAVTDRARGDRGRRSGNGRMADVDVVCVPVFNMAFRWLRDP
ncbi:MAG: hypothetical protein AB7V43_10610 [Acidimicrobiia bacterium]